MNILIIGNTASSGFNFKCSLEKRGHNVFLITNSCKILEGSADADLSWSGWRDIKERVGDVDIVHINAPNFKRMLYALRFSEHAKFIFHWRGADARKTYSTKFIFMWHGSGLRRPIKRFPLEHHYVCGFADFHLFSTVDLQWFLRNLDNETPCKHFRTPVDTDMFKPIIPFEEREDSILRWGQGNISKKRWIPHDQVPAFLNRYKTVECIPNGNLSPYLVSVSALEAAACGCNVVHHPYMNREWVLENASVESQTIRLLDVYRSVLNDEK